MENLWKKSGVYVIINNINQKRYVGCTSNLAHRQSRHFKDLEKNCHGNIHLQRAYNKYGKYAFVFEVIIFCDKEKLLFYEDYWVKILKVLDKEFGYNLRSTSCKKLYNLLDNAEIFIPKEKKKRNYVNTENRKNALKKVHETPVSEETRLKMRKNNAMRNRPEVRLKSSERQKGKIMSEETRLKISKSNLENKKDLRFLLKYRTKEVRERANKNISNYIVLDETTGKTYNSIQEAAKELNIKPETLTRWLKGKVKKTKPYKLLYKDKPKQKSISYRNMLK